MKLDSLAITAFRGLRDEKLSLAGKSLLLYGENGTGKSSVVDALEYLATGTVSHLDGSQATSVRKHAPHVGLPATALAVEATFRGHVQSARRGADAVLSGPPALREFVGLLGRSNFILRRAQLLAFITSQDAPRYQQLSGLIGADALDGVEQKWKDAADAADEHRDRRTATYTLLRAQLESSIGPLPTVNAVVLLERTNAKLAELEEAPLASLEDAEARRLATMAGSAHRANAERAAQLKARVSIADCLDTAIVALASYEEFWLDIETLHAQIAVLIQTRMLAIWRAAHDLLVSHSLDACPLCERPIDASTLAASLRARIARTEEISARVSALTSTRNRLRAALERVRAETSSLNDHLAAEQTHAAASAELTEFAGWCTSWLVRLDAPVEDLALGTFASFAAERPLNAIAASIDGVRLRTEVEIATLVADASDERIVAVADVLGRVAAASTPMLSAAQELNDAEASAIALRVLHTALVEARKRRVQEVYDTLEAEITRFYHGIHPNEPYGPVKLRVSVSRRGSAAIRTSFADVGDVDPRAYNSEAHLDSLGLCVFLAFVKHFGHGVPLLVLDDVVSSVDAAHRTRICRLLLTEFSDVQLLVTTHDALWFEEFISIARALRYTSLTPMRITSWSLEAGPCWAPYTSRWADMRAKAEADDKQGAASLARHTLEGVLFQLAVNLQAQIIPRADARYDVGALLEPVLSRAKKLNPRFEGENRAALTAFRSSALLGNLLTHNNLIAAGTVRQEVIDFVDAVVGLHAIFYCTQCGELIKYIRDAKTVQCQCGPGGMRWDVA